MAIDTQQKRMSVVGAGRPWHRTKLAGTINLAWRLASGNVYAGNTIAVLATGTTTGHISIQPRLAGEMSIAPRLAGSILIKPRTVGQTEERTL